MFPLPTGSGSILAGIDVGTLTCRLLIAEVFPDGRLREVRSDRRILRLGQDVDRDRRLRSDAMQRVTATLKEWRQIMNDCHVRSFSVVATSAVRDALNREEFLEVARRDAQMEIEIISGEEEARRTMLGIRSGLPHDVADLLALDIGGGSTELILHRLGQPIAARSMDIGVVRLSERILRSDPPTGEEVRQAREWVSNETAAAVKDMLLSTDLTFVGTAGTITSLAAMAQQLPAYEPARIHNYILNLDTVKALEEQLLSKSKTQREDLPGLERGREEVIVAGVIILSKVMETLRMSECLVSDLGLREGVLINLAMRITER
ncbi:MAG TPA: Ppx/GppA phosphatase family protein [Nitrospira sp.]|nr:Ppx/GppA phosphatase family protein [Nitrospira sp.]